MVPLATALSTEGGGVNSRIRVSATVYVCVGQLSSNRSSSRVPLLQVKPPAMGSGPRGWRTILAPRSLCWFPPLLSKMPLMEVSCNVQHRASTQFTGATVMTTVILLIQCSVQLQASRSGVPSRLLEEFDRLPPAWKELARFTFLLGAMGHLHCL